MPRERLPFKREYKGDITINIAEIFRNPDMQNEAIRGCKRLAGRAKRNIDKDKTNNEQQ